MILHHLLLVFVAATLLGGCAVTHTINLPTHTVTGFDLVDSRPQEDKETSYGKLEGKYAISKFGDSSFVPDRLVVLKSLLDDKYGEALKGKRVEVVRFRTLVYLAPRNNLGEMINSLHGLAIYPGIPDPQRDWWLFEIAISVDGQRYEKNIAEETPEIKFCPSCNQEIRSKAVAHALGQFVADFGRNVSLR